LKYDWDAKTYDNISGTIQSWGLEILEYRNWKGNEIVVDAGCGSGRLTKMLSIKVPFGKVFAVDSDLSMITLAKQNLKTTSIQFIKNDISEIKLADNVDVVFSNAVLHWIVDHKKVFERFWHILKPGGQLLIQCGGYGNLLNTISIFSKVRKSIEFYKYFCNDKEEDIWNEPWYFATKEDTEKILQKIGFQNIQVSIENKEVNFNNKNAYFIFIKTIILRPYLEYLSNDALKNKFVKAVIQEIETNVQELQWKLDYVRLNINAIK
jgi:trans-aconitate 2-methyltransferase